jgi:hypothetical protein
MANSVVSFFRSLVQDTISAREQKGIVRPDMIHLLMQARKGTLQVDENGTNNHQITKPSIQHNIVFFFFFLKTQFICNL